MKYKKLYYCIILFFVVVASTHARVRDELPEDFFNKKEVTILVTDSGLGGLSVVADLSKRMSHSGIFRTVQVIFFNALFHENSGYNSLSSTGEKVRIFDIVLQTMNEKYQPDLLLIACNTLSVIYDQTEFSKKTTFPVIGIVDIGVELIAQQFGKTPNSSVIIFATETTIHSGIHKKKLTEFGYDENQIIGQSCPLLSESIEQDFDGELTWAMIEEYKSQAFEKLHRSDTTLFASLNCTHYGYSTETFRRVFSDAGYPDIVIIDPNTKMTDFMFRAEFMNRFPKTDVKVDVISKTKISEDRVNSLAPLLNNLSPETAIALKKYQYDADLFDPKFEIKQ